MERFKTIVSLLHQQAKAHADSPALLDVEGQIYTYFRLQRWVTRIANTLHEENIRRTDKVVSVFPNGIRAAVGFLGTAACATAAPLNPGLSRDDYERLFMDLGAAALLTERGMDSSALTVANEGGLAIIDLPSASTDERIPERGELATGQAQPHERDVALVLSTSGTISKPKRVPLTHANLMVSARNVASGLALSPKDRGLNVMPLFHIHGIVAGLLASLASGGSVVCAPAFEGSGFLSWLEVYHPSWYTAVPSIHQALLSAMDDRGIQINTRHSLRLIRSSSSALPPLLMAQLERRMGVPVIEAYGMTEASHQIASNPLPPAPRKPGSVGLARDVEVIILDTNGQPQPRNTEGEIAIRGKTVTAGYEEANSSAFDNGWFRTGDAGYIDDDGYIFLTGRLKEMVNRGGEKIAPREIDDALLEHPSVSQAVAFSVPHPTLGEDIVAAVVLKEEGETMSEGALRAHLLGRIAEFKVPSRLLFVDEIPKGPTGKLQRIELAEALKGQMTVTYSPPQTPLETQLAEIWSGVLGVDRVGREDNFFALGGDSLSASRVFARVNERLAARIGLRQMFEAPTLKEQAIRVLAGLIDKG